MITRLVRVSLASVALALPALGCTANVEDPDIDQTGEDEADDCATECEDTQTTCVAGCNDDGCKGTCKTTYDDCVTACE